jgi:hypothetical protein
MGNGPAAQGIGGAGGSGIVVIRYPSYQAPAKSTTGSPQTYIAGSWRVYVWTSSGTITFLGTYATRTIHTQTTVAGRPAKRVEYNG